MSQTHENHQTNRDSAFNRLEEFPSDPIALAEHVAKEQRITEMYEWAESVGAHTELLARKHHETSRAIVELAQGGELDSKRAQQEQAQLVNIPRDWRTGVRVKQNGDIEVSKNYPFSGDSPAGNSVTLRSPSNFKK